MKIKDIAKAIERWAPPSLAESYDNVGLLVGDRNAECTGVLINLDVTESMLDEAKEAGCNLIVTHHPIWFTGIKRLNGNTYVERIIEKAIKMDIGLYAVHTNLDNVRSGVNEMIADKLGLQNRRILSPKSNLILKLEVFVPVENAQEVLEGMWEAGAGKMGNYTEASFRTPGTGTFKPGEGANPAIGEIGNREEVAESRIEVVFPAYLKGAVIAAMIKAHPYEMPAYQVLAVQGSVKEIGSGMIGFLPEPLGKEEFLRLVADAFGCGGIRYADAPLTEIRKVALCGGAGSFLTRTALSAGADAFVTGDITYHKFFDNEERILLLDIGHYESEQFTSELIYSYLSEIFPNFAVHLSKIISNPVKYFT